MGIQSTLVGLGGDIWASKRMLAIWPWPAVLVGKHSNAISGDDYRCFCRLLEPGDFLLTNCSSYFLSNFFIAKRNGTAFSHLAVYSGPVLGRRSDDTGFILKASPWLQVPGESADGPGRFKRTITHAISEGVVVEDLFDLFKHVDWAVAVRAWETKEQAAAIVKAGLGQVGLEYNFDFKPGGNPSSYCTELGAFCLKAAGIEEPEKRAAITSLAGIIIPAKGFKTSVYLADDYLVKFRAICCSMSCGDPDFSRRGKGKGFRKKLLEAPDASTFSLPNSARGE